MFLTRLSLANRLLVGLLMLDGIVVTSAIVLMGLINRLRGDGAPILMTATPEESAIEEPVAS